MRIAVYFIATLMTLSILLPTSAQQPPDAPAVKTKRSPTKLSPDEAEKMRLQIERLKTREPEITPFMRELDAFQAQVSKCWKVDKGKKSAGIIEIRIQLTRDGILAGAPTLQNQQNDLNSLVAAEGAIHALIRCQPYKMFSAETYETWKDMIIGFAPQ